MNAKKASTAKRLLLIAELICALPLAAGVSLHLYRRASAEQYHTEHSPDGRFSVVVYRIPMLWAMPGSASDAPGYIRLLDSTGHTLQQADVEMVQNAGPIEWSSNRVYVASVGEWPLPQ